MIHTVLGFPRPQITLTLDLGGWSATFAYDATMYNFFQTDTIPTAFTRHDSAFIATRGMALAYPNHRIIVR